MSEIKEKKGKGRTEQDLATFEIRLCIRTDLGLSYNIYVFKKFTLQPCDFSFSPNVRYFGGVSSTTVQS